MEDYSNHTSFLRRLLLSKHNNNKALSGSTAKLWRGSLQQLQALKTPFFLFDLNQTTLKKKTNEIPLNIFHDTIIKDFSCLNIKAEYSDHPSGDEVSHPGSHGCDLHEALVPDAHVVGHHVRPASRGDPQRKT